MDVRNDPFPREEVTGLAAFEDLEPVSSLSVAPDAEGDSESGAPDAGDAADPNEAEPPVASRGPAQARTRAYQHVADADLRDPTLPLDLTAEQAQYDADHLFDGSQSPSWDDPDEATRVVTPHAHAPSTPPQPVASGTGLQMDWDEDEPLTEMRPEAMLQRSPLGVPIDWDEREAGRYDADTSGDGSDASDDDSDESDDDDDERDQTPAFNAQHERATGNATTTMTGGRPSPFPTMPSVPPRDVAFRSPSEALGAPSPFADTLPPARARDSFVDALKGGDRRTWFLAGGVAVGLIVLSLILRAVLAGPTLGVVTLTTAPIDARVTVDGRPVSGTSSPFSMSDVTPGRHDLVITKAGFTDHRSSFTLERGETKALPLVKLTPSVQEVGFSIRSTPAGAAVWVDGQASDQFTPARLTEITPGIHRLQLKLAGYADFELQMFVPDATVLQLPTAELVRAAAAAPPSAAQAESTASTKPEAEADDAPAHPHKDWRAARAARLASKGITPREPREPREPKEPRVARASSVRQAAPQAAPTMAAPVATPVPVMASAAPANGKLGTLRLNSRPWSQVIVDGRIVGNTPQPALQLTAGKHKIQLVNQPMGLSKTISVTIKAGQVVTQVLNLAD